MNLSSIYRECVSEETVVALASTLKQPVQKVSAAMSGAVPTVLCLYAEKSATPAGADQVFDAVRTGGGLIVDTLAEAFTGLRGENAMELGQRMLSTLFGRTVAHELAGTVSRFSGMDVGASSSLLGAANLIALISLRKAGKARNGQEIASLISEAKPEIMQAIPEGMRDYLDSVPQLRAVAFPYDDGTSATGGDDQMQGEAAMHSQEPFSNERLYGIGHDQGLVTSLAWIIPSLAFLAILGALVYTLYPRQAEKAPGPGVPSVLEGAQPAAGIIRGAEELSGVGTPSDPQLARELGEEIDRFGRITSGSGNFVLPPDGGERLTAISGRLDALARRLERLPLAEQQAIARQVNRMVPSLDVAAQRAIRAPGNGEAIPMIQKVQQQLHELARQPA